MSYDLSVGSAERPAHQHIEAWAADHGLRTETHGDELHVHEGETFRFDVSEPVLAEPEDFPTDAIEARWMTYVTARFDDRAIALARRCAQFIAATNHGGADDHQEGRLIWPRGATYTRARTPPPETWVELCWFVAEWRPAALLDVLEEHLPQALPERFGPYEPYAYRLERDRDAFGRDDSGHWRAVDERFSGTWFDPYNAPFAQPGDQVVGQIILRAPERTDALITTFRAAAEALDAFFAAGEVVSREVPRQNYTRTRIWQGLPPKPLWLSWFGAPYRDLVGVDFVRGRTTLPDELTFRHRAPWVTNLNGSRTSVLPEPEDAAARIPRL